MTVRSADVVWKGDLTEGSGRIKLESGAYDGPYSFRGRTTNETDETNPEELIAAAHAGCFSMQLSAMLTKAGHAPDSIHSVAKVTLDKVGQGFEITGIDLTTEGKVPGISADEFKKIATDAKNTCPVSKALSAVKINFTAKFIE